MKGRLGKSGTIFLAVALCLALTGAGFAAWTDNLTIKGTVTTGSLAWEFTDCHLMDDDAPTDPGGDYPTVTPDYTCNDGFVLEPGSGYYWELDKNVGWGEQLLVDTTGDMHYDTLDVTLWNTYPSYFNSLTFYVNNYGTVPLKVDHVLINGNKVTSPGTWVGLDFNGDNQDDFEIQWGDSFGAQIEPGGASPEFSFWMHVLQPCPQAQLDQLHFNVTIVGVQWNEYPLP